MNISTQVDREKSLRRYTLQGLFDVLELIRFVKEVHAAPDFCPSIKILVDLRDADISTVSVEAVETIIENVKNIWSDTGKNRAALVVSDTVGYGVSRMFQSMMSGATVGEVRVFKDMDEALIWIESA